MLINRMGLCFGKILIICFLYAVSISRFQDSRFPMINYVWETEDFVGLLNFTLWQL